MTWTPKVVDSGKWRQEFPKAIDLSEPLPSFEIIDLPAPSYKRIAVPVTDGKIAMRDVRGLVYDVWEAAVEAVGKEAAAAVEYALAAEKKRLGEMEYSSEYQQGWQEGYNAGLEDKNEQR